METDKSKIKVVADSVSGEDLLPGSYTVVFLLCLHMAERGKELFRVSFVRALISFKRAPPS